MLKLEAGHEFRDPDNPSQGYRLTRFVTSSDPVKVNQFKAFGGAPEPQEHHEMPRWLVKQITSLRSR